MRILLVNTYYYPEMIGGTEHSVKKLAEALVRDGHQVWVLCTGDADADEEFHGVRVLRRRTRNLTRVRDMAGRCVAVRRLHQLLEIHNPFNAPVFDAVIKMVRPDVVHTNGLFDFSPSIWRAARRRGVPVVHTLRDYTLLCRHTTLMPPGSDRRCEAPTAACKAYREANLRQLKNVNRLTAASEFMRRQFAREGFASEESITVLPNAIDFDPAQVARLCDLRRQRERGALKFAYIGGLTEHKGVRWLLESFQSVSCPDVQLHLAGDGPLKGFVMECAQRDLRIRYRGFLPETEISNLLTECDVLVCPSLWDEPFGRVVLDAYKHAMPVIATDRGALPELVVREGAGNLIDASDSDSLREAIEIFIKMWYDKHVIYYHSAEQLASYSIPAQARAFAELYREAIDAFEAGMRSGAKNGQ